MMKGLFFFFYMLLLTSLEVFAQQSYSSDCATCYGSKNTECEQKCTVPTNKNQPGKFAKCKRSCVVNECKNICNYKVGDKGALPEIVSCDYCSREAQTSCKNSCGEDSSENCIKRCVSRTCAKNCSLPTSSQDILTNDREPTAKDIKNRCTACKTTNTEACATSCGTGTGSTTCKVVCLESKCEQDCLIE